MKNLNWGVVNNPDRLGLELLEFCKNLTADQSCISLTGWLVPKHLTSIFKKIHVSLFYQKPLHLYVAKIMKIWVSFLHDIYCVS